MVIILAVVIAILVGFGAWKFLRGENHQAPKNPDSPHSELIVPMTRNLS